MTESQTCPSAEQLRGLVDGTLVASEQDFLSRHVEECNGCQQTLDQLAATSWEEKARDFGAQEPTPPALREVVRAAQAQGMPSATQALTAAEAHGGPAADTFGYLAPPAQPGNLGRLDHYEFLEVIGKGGFGVVFKARDEKLDRLVAIKVLSPALAGNGTARRRFIREAKAAAAFRNDHVIAIHAVSDAGDIPYLVMELIGGVSLQEKMDRTGPLDVKEILRIGMQIADGLAAAHKQGLVHRDIKPANILLENGVERVKITDFGLARAVDDASVTQSGTVAGTPMYMSPEQAEGLLVDHRSDLFSLGTVLYALCTGRPPFRATGTMAVLKRVVEETPRPIAEINSEIPQWLCDIIAKLHAKKPEDRYQTAREMAEVLGQGLAHLQQPGHNAAPAPMASSIGRWQVGDRVLAPLEPEWLYVATVEQTKGESLFVSYCDGESDWVKVPDVRPLDIDKGARVWAWWNGPYYPGTVTERKGYSVHIAYDDGDREWTELSYIRVPSGKTEDGAAASLIVPSEGDRRRAAAVFAPTMKPGLARLWQSTLIGLAVGAIIGGWLGPIVVAWLGDPRFVLVVDPPGWLQDSVALVSLLQGAVLGAIFGAIVGLARWMLLLRLSWEIRNGLRSAAGVRGPRPAMTPGARRFAWSLLLPVFAGVFVVLVVLMPKPWRGGEATAPPNGPGIAPVADSNGWVRLFNGKDFTGWKALDRSGWTIEDGAIVGRGIRKCLFSERDDFQNFHFRAEVKMNAAGDGGIVFGVPFAFDGGRGKVATGAYQAQLGLPWYPSGVLHRWSPSWAKIKDVTRLNGHLHKADEWFVYEVIVQGKHIQVLVNGQVYSDFHDAEQTPARGHLMLYLYGLPNAHPPSEMHFRKIEVKELRPPDGNTPPNSGWVRLFKYC
jgi:serine/threonine protein kinase